MMRPVVAASRLFPPSETRQTIDTLLTQALDAARLRVNAGSVVPTFDRSAFAAQLRAFDFTTPGDIAPVLDWVIAQMETGLVHVAHPRYFGLFNPTPSAPAQWGERIIATFNAQLATATTSPAAVAIETHTIAALAQRAGLPAATAGHFTTGGSEANATALLLALSRACPAFASTGARGFAGPPRFYISHDSHLAWLKIAHQSGIGRDAARLVATDGMGRMSTAALSDAIEADRREGHVPVMIVATAGTTNAGMIDPIANCAALADQYGMWLHVDAAWGGGLIASERVAWRSLLDGIEQADSLTIDAHKWFATTMGCGAFLTRHPALLPTVFRVATQYMPSDRAEDPYTTSLQWSRRFLGLRLFLSLAIAGWAGHGAHVEHCLMRAAQLRRQMQRYHWQVVNDSPLGVDCLLPPNKQDVRSIVARVLASGQAWVSVAMFEGRNVIRTCVTSGETTKADVLTLATCLHQSATEL